jgi:hypothetical protein
VCFTMIASGQTTLHCTKTARFFNYIAGRESRGPKSIHSRSIVKR